MVKSLGEYFRKWLVSLIAFALLAIGNYPGEAAVNIGVSISFPDINGHWAYSTIQKSLQLGIVEGYEDGTFRPNQQVTEAEFLAMLVRAFPEAKLTQGKPGDAWYQPYYDFAYAIHWPIFEEHASETCLRGKVASVIAASQGNDMDEDASVIYLLQHQLAQGKTSNSLAGFHKEDPLTRAEALQFIANMLDHQLSIVLAETASGSVQIRGIILGDSVETVMEKLGEPDRKDTSEYRFQWYIYNQDYRYYAQIGIQNGKVVALLTNADNWSTDKGVHHGSTKETVEKLYGKPLEYITKGNTRYMMSGTHLHSPVYLTDDGYVTFFFDIHRNNTATGIQLIDQSIEEKLVGFYGTPSDDLRLSFEHQIFDLANVSRVSHGKEPFRWDDKISETARKHSKDMADNDYFSHEDRQGSSPFDRMKADGIAYRSAAENIAAGQTNAMFAHSNWMNSAGHRENLLGNTQYLGVGVYFGGEMHIYYTQNFYTPMK